MRSRSQHPSAVIAVPLLAVGLAFPAAAATANYDSAGSQDVAVRIAGTPPVADAAPSPVPADATPAAATPADAANLVGRRVPPFPPTLPELGGTCFSAPGHGSAAEVCAYSVSVHGSDADNPSHAMVLKAVGRDDDAAIWRVLDVIERPEIAGAGFLHYGCEPLAGDARVVLAVADMASDGEWYDPVHRAWAFDFSAEHIREIDTARVRCLNEGYGYDG